MTEHQYELDMEPLDTTRSILQKMEDLQRQHPTGNVNLFDEIYRSVGTAARSIESGDVRGVEHYMDALWRSQLSSEDGGYDLPVGYREEVKKIWDALVAQCAKRSAFSGLKFPDSSWTAKLRERGEPRHKE